MKPNIQTYDFNTLQVINICVSGVYPPPPPKLRRKTLIFSKIELFPSLQGTKQSGKNAWIASQVCNDENSVISILFDFNHTLLAMTSLYKVLIMRNWIASCLAMTRCVSSVIARNEAIQYPCYVRLFDVYNTPLVMTKPQNNRIRASVIQFFAASEKYPLLGIFSSFTSPYICTEI